MVATAHGAVLFSHPPPQSPSSSPQLLSHHTAHLLRLCFVLFCFLLFLFCFALSHLLPPFSNPSFFASARYLLQQPTPDLLQRKPYGRNKALLSRIMLRQIGGHSIYQLIVILFLVFYADQIFDIPNGGDLATGDDEQPSQHFTIVFNTFVWMQIFNEINARVIHDDLVFVSDSMTIGGPLGAFLRPFKGFFTNPIFVFVVIGTAVAQTLITEFGGHALFTEPLTGAQWGLCIVRLYWKREGRGGGGLAVEAESAMARERLINEG